MGSLYLNRLSQEDRRGLVSRLLSSQQNNCFICGQRIDLGVHDGHIEIDHVEPIKVGGRDGPDNFAVTHESCNRSKQASDLRVARILSSFDQMAASLASENRSPNLGDILTKYDGAKHDLSVTLADSHIRMAFSELDDNDVFRTPVYTDPLSGFRYAFLNLPIEYLHHDNRINPRPIGRNLRKIVEEFHKKLPQLHVALAWIEASPGGKSRVHVFDGQHKAAAQIFLGVRRLPIRVFIDPDTDILLTANTHAGTTLRQVAFDKSVQRGLGSSLLVDRMNRFRRERGRPDDDESFSERDMVNHFWGESREMKRYVLDWVRNSVTTHPDNKLRDYIEYGGRGTDMPLSYSAVEKTFYSFFIYNNLLDTPFNHRSEEGENPRHLEIDQLVRLMNIIAERIFIGKFDHSRGARRIESNIQRGRDVPEPHLCAFRMAKEEILYNWLRYVRQVVQNYFVTTGLPIDEVRLFQYSIPDTCSGNVENFVESLRKLPLWVNRDLSLSVFGGKHNNSFWQEIFMTGRTPEGAVVMPGGINLMNMISHGGTPV